MTRKRDPSSYPAHHYARWTEEERAIIRAHWPLLPSNKIAEAFPGRTKRAVDAQAEMMGLKKSIERMVEMGKENIASRWGRKEDPPGAA